MSLSALINGADCGPMNPLQGLSKRFDADRGLAQDQFHSGRAGSSREVFRSQPPQASASFAAEASAFFKGSTPPTASHSPAPFDLSAIKSALPPAAQRHSPVPTYTPRQGTVPPNWASDFTTPDAARSATKPNVSWAGDFMKQQAPSPLGQAVEHQQQPGLYAQTPSFQAPLQQPFHPMAMTAPMPFMQHTPSFHSQAPMQATATQSAVSSSAWETHFMDAEAQHTEAQTTAQPSEVMVDDLAATAGLLLDSLRNESNEKFKKSAFMDLMRQVRDHEMIVEGNDMIPASEAIISAQPLSYEAKGKMRAYEPGQPILQRRKSVHFDQMTGEPPLASMDDFQDWDQAELEEEVTSSHRSKMHRIGIIEAQEAEWARLQEDWDQWDATSTGFAERVSEGARYEFQRGNPYMNREYMRSRTRAGSIYQSVLEKEAEVQRNPQSAAAWLALGMKQQENEREDKAIAALRRALELDSTLLSAWLALAISHTNEGSRHDAYQALQQWIDNNDQYKDVSAKYQGRSDGREESEFVSMREKGEKLVNCLIEMAMRGQEMGVDADVQIALAVLLNASEDYERSLDCFKAALEVRPDDFLLYNRVGATLANSGRPDEALAYYDRALEFNPTYIRARYNLGISCISLRRYDEAASHMLDALVLQETEASERSPGEATPGTQGVTSSSLWDTLRTICHHLQRPELAELCERRDLDGFRAVFQQ